MADPTLASEHHVFRYGGEFAELIIKRASGAWVYDRSGRAILDFTSGQMSSILGHSHPEVVAAVKDGITELDHLHSSFLSDPVIDFAANLSALLPDTLSKVLPLSTGGESNEAALRMAKLSTSGFEVVAFDRSWHGVTGGAASAGMNTSNPSSVSWRMCASVHKLADMPANTTLLIPRLRSWRARSLLEGP